MRPSLSAHNLHSGTIYMSWINGQCAHSLLEPRSLAKPGAHSVGQRDTRVRTRLGTRAIAGQDVRRCVPRRPQPPPQTLVVARRWTRTPLIGMILRRSGRGALSARMIAMLLCHSQCLCRMSTARYQAPPALCFPPRVRTSLRQTLTGAPTNDRPRLPRVWVAKRSRRRRLAEGATAELVRRVWGEASGAVAVEEHGESWVCF